MKNFEVFCENHPPTRPIKYKLISFAPSTKWFMAIKLPSTNLEQFLRRIESLIMRQQRKSLSPRTMMQLLSTHFRAYIICIYH